MRLTRIQFFLTNNAIRLFVQKRLEFKIFKAHLKRHSLDLAGKVILDAGCGSGYGSELIINEFKPSEIIGFDLMPEQIELAKERALRAKFFVGDVTKIGLPSDTFDAVVICGVLHHVPEWRKALREVARVLKPGGILLIEEIHGAVVHLWIRLGFTHPKDAGFDWSEFEEGAAVAGFEILEKRKVMVEAFKSFLCLKVRANDA